MIRGNDPARSPVVEAVAITIVIMPCLPDFAAVLA
jgi:hypothetical protein